MSERANQRDAAADRVRIFDTTLRDGEQSPGASLTSDEKVEVARQLAALGVDVIEAGFPAASPDDLAAVRRIATEVGRPGGPVIAGLARATREDVDRAWRGVEPAARPRIHTFLATSELHMRAKLGMTRPQVVAAVRAAVAHARGYVDDVEFSPEDGSRSDPGFLVEVLAAAIEAGATTLNIPDTVGYAVPEEYAALVARLIAETPGGSGVVWSVHCHDDLGLATANTLAGILAGARQAEVTVNGIGERAGNTALEEVVMALHTRRPVFGLTTGIDTRQLARTSRMVRDFTGIVVPPNKAIVGDNAFAHEAGIHQDGMLKDQRTYEIMTPATVGQVESRLVLGKHSGRHAFRVRLAQLGVELEGDDLVDAFRRFKALAERKKTVTNADLLALAREEITGPREVWGLVELQVSCGTPRIPTATVRLHGPGGEESVAAAIGDGPVDAAFRAIQEIVGVPNELVDYRVESVGGGIDALGEVTLRIVPQGEADEAAPRSYGGYGADTDVIIAGVKAYLAALNRCLLERGDEVVARPPERGLATGTAERPADGPRVG